MTCQTDDPEREREYLEFIEEIEPLLKPRFQRLRECYVNSPARGQLSRFYHVLDRSIANQVDLFREENVPLETEEAKLAQRYQKIAGAMTVKFQGEEQTLPSMARYLEEPERDIRREAWGLSEERRLRDREVLEGIYDELLTLRGRIARNAGFSDYRDYAFRRRFGGAENWASYEEVLENQWQRQLHLFELPFYYIEYGIAQLGALGVWQNAEEDPKRAIASYRRALELGGSRPLPELFAAAGLRFDFSSQAVSRTVGALRAELL